MTPQADLRLSRAYYEYLAVSKASLKAIKKSRNDNYVNKIKSIYQYFEHDSLFENISRKNNCCVQKIVSIENTNVLCKLMENLYSGSTVTVVCVRTGLSLYFCSTVTGGLCQDWSVIVFW